MKTDKLAEEALVWLAASTNGRSRLLCAKKLHMEPDRDWYVGYVEVFKDERSRKGEYSNEKIDYTWNPIVGEITYKGHIDRVVPEVLGMPQAEGHEHAWVIGFDTMRPSMANYTAQDAIDDCTKLAHYLDGYTESEEPVERNNHDQ